MTWPEICEELVKRWPTQFEMREPLPGISRTERLHLAEYEYMPREDDLGDIHHICEIIGAVVYSYPSWSEDYGDIADVGIRGWIGGCVAGRVLETQAYFDTRPEAELAALGAWLEATR